MNRLTSKATKKTEINRDDSDNEPKLRDGNMRQPELPDMKRNPTSRLREFRSDGPDKLVDIKRRLLQTGDWATLCVARPLKIGFMPIDERERVGKRRRVTEEDRARQAAPTKQVISPEFYRMRTKRQRTTRCPKSSALEDISIRIGGRSQQQRSPIMQSQLMSLSQQSSEAMLLDKEEAGYIHEVPKTPTPIQLKHFSPHFNPYTPRRGGRPSDRLTEMIESPTVFAPITRGNGFTPNADEGLASGRSALSGESGSRNYIAAKRRPVIHGFLGSTPITGSKSFYERGQCDTISTDTQTKPRANQRLFDEYTASQSTEHHDISTGDIIETSSPWKGNIRYDSSIPGRGKLSQPLDERQSAYGSPNGPYIGSEGFIIEDRRFSVDSIPETERIYRSIETESESGSPACIGNLRGKYGESRDENMIKKSPDRVPVSDYAMPHNRITDEVPGCMHESPSASLHHQAVFGEKLDQKVTPTLGKEDSWMQLIFDPQMGSKSPRFGNLDIGIARNKHKSKAKSQNRGTDSSIIEEIPRSNAGHAETPANSKPPIHTSVNTSLNSRNMPVPSPTNRTFVSDTDFLSNLSPMEGLLDEGLAQLSVYNNATRTIRSPSPPSSASPFGYNGVDANHGRCQQDQWDSQSPTASAPSLARISTQNQPAQSLQGKGISSPDPLSIDITHSRGEGRTVVGNLHVAPQRTKPVRRQLWVSSPEDWIE
ncbi:hypothetical protein FQN54_006816 [Arachnomyces sp. PD_36]|nr:hypothetical protein FQN54_006816 [Arachnomyces sp. PD_36]